MTTIAVFGSSSTLPGTHEWSEAVSLGRALAERGWTVATGGYGGTMEAVSEGAASTGIRVVGVTAPRVFPGRDGTNPHVAEERPAPTVASRIASLIDASAAAIALPGSLGTLTELVVAWNTSYVAPFGARDPKPVVAIGPQWSRVVGFLTEILPSGSGHVTLVDDIHAALAHLDAALPRPSPRRAIP